LEAKPTSESFEWATNRQHFVGVFQKKNKKEFQNNSKNKKNVVFSKAL